MLNILVPTDLSDLSKVAVQYAIKIANKLDGNITLLHVVSMVEPIRADMQAEFKAVEKELIEEAKANMEKLVQKVSKGLKSTQPISIRIVKGSSFVDTLKKEAKKTEANLVVMGTRGASGLKKYVMGSNTASVIEESNIPVLAVPEEAVFKNFKNVVYATDLKHIEKEIKTLMPYLEGFGSTVHLIHITTAQKNVETIAAKIAGFVNKSGYKNLVGHVVVSDDVDDAIESYVESSNADLLAMFTHDPTVYEKVFFRSVTRKMAFQSKIPLLAFKKR